MYFCYGGVLCFGQWVYDVMNDKGDDDNGEVLVIYKVMDLFQQFEQWLRDEL